jgi:hypothetical protein
MNTSSDQTSVTEPFLNLPKAARPPPQAGRPGGRAGPIAMASSLDF